MSLALARRHLPRSQLRQPGRRFNSSQGAQGEPRSAHAQWYAEMLPGMVPVALLGSAVYMGLRLLQANLSHERYLDETHARVRELEREVEVLRAQRELEAVTVAATAVTAETRPKSRGWFW